MRTINIDGQLLEQEQIKPLIREACIEVLNIYGQNGLTMSRVARQAGIAKGTLYNYFPSKEAMLKNVCESFAQPIFDEVVELLDADRPPREILIALLRAKVNAFRQYRRVIEAFLSQFGKNSLVEHYEEDSFKARIIEILKQIFEKALARGVKLPFPVEIMTEIYDGATTGLARCIPESDAGPDAFPTEEEIIKFVDIFLPDNGS